MHTGPVSGNFVEEWKESSTLHACAGKVTYRLWESSCGGYDDYQFRCDKCKKTWWVEGSDS